MRAHNFYDLTGRTFSHWQVLRFSRIVIRPSGKRSSLWLCRCDCGTEKEVIGAQLVYGSSTRCKRCPRMKPQGISSRNTVLAEYKRAAAERGYSSFVYTGIDHVDNSRGYEPDNVVPCCRRCNRAKDVMSQEEFLSWANQIVNHSRIKQDATPSQSI